MLAVSYSAKFALIFNQSDDCNFSIAFCFNLEAAFGIFAADEKSHIEMYWIIIIKRK